MIDDYSSRRANRWIDGGLGASYPQILARLDHLSPGNRDAYCFSVVISPDPEAMAAWRERQDVDGDPYERFVETIRETMEEWETWRLDNDPRPQAGRIEYSFVVHRPACPERSRGEREYGEQMHAHLILPAATEHLATRDKTPFYNYRPHGTQRVPEPDRRGWTMRGIFYGAQGKLLGKRFSLAGAAIWTCPPN